MDQSVTQPVEDAVNELIEEEIGVHANISWFDAATYGTQIPMQIQANEPLDLIMYTPVPGASFPSYMAAGQLMDISEILEEEGQDLLELEGDLIKGVSIGDEVYGIPNYRSLTGSQAFFVRKDLADENGVTEAIENAKTWSEMEAALKTITDASGIVAVVNCDAEGTVLNPRPFMAHGDNFEDAYWYDQVGDGYNMILVDEATDTVMNYYATDDYKEMAERVQNWYNEGLIYKDAATTQDYADTLVKSGAGFAQNRAIEIGSLEASQAMTGYELIQKDVTSSKLGTSSTQKFGYCVPVTATEPEAAVRYVNFLMTSPELCNLLTWGVEGQNWVLNADGQATYPEGVTADNVGYHTSDFLYGNQILIAPWEGSALDIREQQQTEMDNAERSKYMGFSVDNTGLENTIAACHDVCNQFHPMLDSGSSGDYEKTLEEFNSRLEAAGMNELLAAYQEQLDAWLAENG
jgi:putative aldouronate transport system substrate-binding protein